MYRQLPLLVLATACRTQAATPDTTDASSDGADSADAAAMVDADDGVPTRQPCTTQFGNALDRSFGRLDGILVAIVWPESSKCNADEDHVLLQIRANDAVYEIAINVGSPTLQDVKSAAREIVLPGGAWSEGWHTGTRIDYVSMSVRAADLTLQTRSEHVTTLMAELANANHVSVFATGYAPQGAHLVHRNGNGTDGLLITQPLSNPAHARLFSFANQAF